MCESDAACGLGAAIVEEYFSCSAATALLLPLPLWVWDQDNLASTHTCQHRHMAQLQCACQDCWFYPRHVNEGAAEVGGIGFCRRAGRQAVSQQAAGGQAGRQACKHAGRHAGSLSGSRSIYATSAQGRLRSAQASRLSGVQVTAM